MRIRSTTYTLALLVCKEGLKRNRVNNPVALDNTLQFGRIVTVAYYMKHMAESMNPNDTTTVASWTPYKFLQRCSRLAHTINVSATTEGRFNSLRLLFSVDALQEILRWIVEPLDIVLAAKAIPDNLDVSAHSYFAEGEAWNQVANGDRDEVRRIISVVRTRDEEFPEERMRDDFISVQFAKCSDVVETTFDEHTRLQSQGAFATALVTPLLQKVERCQTVIEIMKATLDKDEDPGPVLARQIRDMFDGPLISNDVEVYMQPGTILLGHRGDLWISMLDHMTAQGLSPAYREAFLIKKDALTTALMHVEAAALQGAQDFDEDVLPDPANDADVVVSSDDDDANIASAQARRKRDPVMGNKHKMAEPFNLEKALREQGTYENINELFGFLNAQRSEAAGEPGSVVSGSLINQLLWPTELCPAWDIVLRRTTALMTALGGGTREHVAGVQRLPSGQLLSLYEENQSKILNSKILFPAARDIAFLRSRSGGFMPADQREKCERARNT